MWSKLFLCLLVAFALADHNPGWEHNTEYVYEVRGRTLTSLNQNSNDYSGIFLKAKLAVRPTSEGHLGVKISNLRYANFHAKLQEWQRIIPDSELNYEEIPLSSEVVKVVMNNGVIQDIVVDKNIPNWEANMIKGIVSQLQLDTRAENQIRSSINSFNEQGDNDAVFKTMEKTVTGETETLYEIHPLPEHVLQTKPWLAPLRELRSSGEFIEVVKNKNYTHSKQTPAYHYGLEGIENFDIDSKIGQFFSRSSVSRAILSGNLNKYTIQSSVTVDQVTMQPTLQDKQRGSTNSIVNITLIHVNEISEEFQEISNPVSVGIVYSYNKPFEGSNEARSRMSSSDYSDLLRRESSRSSLRYRRDLRYLSSAENRLSADDEEEKYPEVQEKPHIKEAPSSPLLPLTVGYDGQSIRKKQNIKENVRALAKTIAQELQHPENIPQENTVGKFVILASLVRVMDYEDMKHVADQLYTHETHGVGVVTWVAYRDAVAEAGTGPALLLIREWIKNGQISGEKAAQVVATAADSARQPTEKYMRVFFEMVEDEEIMKQQHLNDSLLLSYTNLAHQVYVNKRDSHNRFPVHSFGSFNTEQGRLFVEKELIPFLARKLEESIRNADTKRIHLYIRALGNVGSQHILEIFKPYLEGTKKVSQFQRVLMVLAFDNFVKNSPEVARSVLFKIYQNPRDFEQVRVAAVYHLVRCNPSPAMLQSMAAYTKIDTSKHVNSAVKSVLEEALNLQQPKFEPLRTAAKSALPMLTSEEYGYQHSRTFMKTYITEQMEMEVKQVAEMFSGEDSVLPKGINYMLRGRFSGVRQQLLKMQWMVSSVEDLVNVFEQQTKMYHRQLKEKQAQNGANTKWSSEYTANLLNVQNEQREQLESFMFLQIDALSKVWSVDNQTIENLTNVVKELEDELRNNKHFDYLKMSVHPESALSFPTVWGLPFIYTYDRPTIFHFESDVKLDAKPDMYSPEGLQKPETVDIEYRLNSFISGRTQTQFGVFAPFNHKRYSAGYDKNFQLNLPAISGKIVLDIRNRQITLEVESNEKKNMNLLHFSTWPYTTQYDIYTPRPQTRVIKNERPQKGYSAFGEKSTGISFFLQWNCDKPVDIGLLYQKLYEQKAAALLGPWIDDDIQHTEFNFGINIAKTTSKKMIIHLGHQKKFTPGVQSDSQSEEKLSARYPISEESWERQKEFLKNSGKGIRSAYSQVVDTIVLFEGQRIIKYSATLAGARSNLDPKGRILMQAEKDNQKEQPLKVYFSAESESPNTNSLDAEFALEFDPTTTFQVSAGVQEKNQNPSEISMNVRLSKSEERKQQLKKHPQYQQCKEEMKDGNKQLSSCAMLTAQANLLDQFSVKITYKNVDSVLVNQTYKMYSFLRENLYPRISENVVMDDAESYKNQISMEGQFSPDLSNVNVSLTTEYGRAEVNNLPLSPLARHLLVPHPVFHIKARMEGHAFNYNTYQPKCVVDKNYANTLDNKTFPINLDNDWVVLLHYIPRRPSSVKGQPELPVSEQLDQNIEGYIVYARAFENDNSKKEIKMVIQSPNTLGKVIDVTFKPAESSSHPRLFVQNQQIVYDNEGSHNNYDDYMQVYQLPNNEIKAEVYDALNIIYDGVRAKIIIVNDKFRDAARGLCGTFTGEPETDFTHPGNCIIHSPEVFVATYTVPEKQRTKRMNDMLMIQAEEKKCYQKTVGYSTVVSPRDSGLTSMRRGSDMMEKTKYVRMGDEVCFSIIPISVCKAGKREDSVSRAVGVHCVKSSGVTELWMNQINNGINVSFAHKPQTREVLFKVAQRCY